jgi:chaperonin GroES
VAKSELLQLTKRIDFDDDVVKSPNLCDRFSKEDLETLGSWCHAGYQRDRMSRSHWERRMTAAMELAIQLQKAKNFPWPNCSNVIFPLITIGALQFSANSYSDVIQGDNIVNYKVIGEDKSGALAKRANRIGRHMSWQVMEQDQDWEEQHDRLLINLSVIGTAFVKTYFDAGLGYPIGEFVSAWDLVVDYWSKSMDTVQRATQRMSFYRNEIYERIERGTFRDVRQEEWYNAAPMFRDDDDRRDMRSGQSPTMQPDADAPFAFLEQHRFLDLDHDGYAEPYTVTLEERSKCITRIVARVKGGEAGVERSGKKIVRINPEIYYQKYPFIPNPDGGFYDLGFGILLGPINESVSTIINQMIDNGTLHNLSGGFIGRGMKIRGGNYTMAPFELKRVDSTGDDIRKNLVLFEPHAPPDILFKLLVLLIDYSNRIAGTTDVAVGENPGQNTPASTYQGMAEKGIRVYAWIFKRIWRAMKGEFRQRYEINRRSLPNARNYGEENALILREDYKGNPDQVAPVADPNLPSSVMRMQQALFVAQRAMMVPGYDHEEVEIGVLRAARVPNPRRIYPGPKDPRGAPLPNPKMQVEEMKLKGKQLDLQHKRQEWANKLMEERRLNTARIQQLEAQAYSLVKGAQAADVKNKLEALEMAINTLKNFSSELSNRIGALSSDESTGPGDESSERGGMGGVAPTSDDSGVPGNAPEGEGEASSPLGSGSPPGQS